MVGSRPPRGPRGPRFRFPRFGWRPSKGLFVAATVLGVLGVLGYGGYWMWTSPFFKVSNVEVVGNQRLATRHRH